MAERKHNLDHGVKVIILVAVLHINTQSLLQDETAAIPHSVFCGAKELGIILDNVVEKSLPFLNQTDSTCEKNVLEAVLGLFML